MQLHLHGVEAGSLGRSHWQRNQHRMHWSKNPQSHLHGYELDGVGAGEIHQCPPLDHEGCQERLEIVGLQQYWPQAACEWFDQQETPVKYQGQLDGSEICE